MSNERLLGKLLQLTELKVKWFHFKQRDRELHLGVKPFKNGCLCPKCGIRGRIVRTVEWRSWTDVAVFGLQICLFYAPKEISCPTHGRIQEEIPWAADRARVSYRLEYRVCALSQIMTQKAAAAIVKLSTSTVSDILHRVITRVRAGHKIRRLVTLGVDEISYCKGRKYSTIVYDLDRSHVVWVGLGKGRSTIDEFFTQQLSDYQRNRITWASCDMSLAYTEAIKHHCPNATLVIDRFHVVKALNEAVDTVRKEEWRSLEGDQRHTIKGLRWLLGMHSRNRTKAQTALLNKLRNSNRRIHRAWLLKDEFERIWHYRYRGAAQNFLKSWITAALKSRIPSMRKFVSTLKKHRNNILAFVKRPLTNAVAEGINRVIKIVKNRASGFRSLESFADLIFLTVGDLDIPEQIPSRLRNL